MEENANKLHFKYTNFNSCMHVTVYAEYIYVLTEYLKYLSIRRHSYFLQCRHCQVCRLSTEPVSCNIFNSLLTPSFVQLFSGNSYVSLFCCVTLQIHTFYQNLVLVDTVYVHFDAVWSHLIGRLHSNRVCMPTSVQQTGTCVMWRRWEQYVYICHYLSSQNAAHKNKIEIEILLLKAKNWVFFCSDQEEDSSLVQYVIFMHKLQW